MKRLHVFISHSSKDKKFAGELKSYFQRYCGFKTFCAHEDIPVSKVWPEEIINSVTKTDVVVALISKNFPSSAFANQEIGIAIALNKKIIPIKLNETNPPGFIDKIQAYSCKSSSYDVLLELVTAIYFILLESEGFREDERIINSLVLAFLNSKSFRDTRNIVDVLLKTKKFGKNHLNKIVRAIKSNNQIYNELYALPKLLNMLKSKYEVDIDITSLKDI